MKLFDRLFKRDKRQSFTLSSNDGWDNLLGGTTAAGITVTGEGALQHPAVLGAVRLLTETVASLPIMLYKRTKEGGRERATEHVVYTLLHDRPNPIQSPFTFKETIMLHLLTQGNAYIAIDWREDGKPNTLWPIHPGRVQLEQKPDGNIVYHVTQQNGTQRTYTTDNMVHVPILSLDGITGRSPLEMAREAIGAALAAEQYAATYFGNAATPSGVLEAEGTLSDTAFERIKAGWQKAYSGKNSHKVAILEEGAKFKPINHNAEEAQLLETRQLALRLVAAILRIPPHMLDPTARGTYANVETQSLEFLVLSLRPLLVRVEEALTLKLFTDSERRRYYVEFLPDALLATDTKTRALVYTQLVNTGVMTPNEARARENLPPLPGGDELKKGGQQSAKIQP